MNGYPSALLAPRTYPAIQYLASCATTPGRRRPGTGTTCTSWISEEEREEEEGTSMGCSACVPVVFSVCSPSVPVLFARTFALRRLFIRSFALDLASSTMARV